ncbi:uncharacterized protein CC84DRAFT_1115765 [Paraphaeosphaeria sporulosa]|uniref:DUF202 domain-containing protein n=1 Tax=Paraphaeosphaeria sporulosa TaxID=1460663 RepID=A0A177CN44_9PLEO|nr:uncharacterized protein CC84DRAFT_1115765 [Paraphaeosphaeria sporulosa]OAG08923.1 hypothetical protein CC84DRAFT_1115765 [Paraphaeosphaeria sporulosa]
MTPPPSKPTLPSSSQSFHLSALNVLPPPPQPDSGAFLRADRHGTAQELEDIPHHPVSARTSSRSSLGSSTRPSHTSTAADTSGSRLRLGRQTLRWHDRVVRFWTSNVSVTIEEGAHRDHLALERTFLGYLRTSLALVMTGIITAQLFRLQHSSSPNPRIGFVVLGVPLAASFIALGMLVLLLGALRFWRQQRALVKGRVWAGGWELLVIMGMSLAVSLSVGGWGWREADLDRLLPLRLRCWFGWMWIRGRGRCV